MIPHITYCNGNIYLQDRPNLVKEEFDKTGSNTTREREFH